MLRVLSPSHGMAAGDLYLHIFRGINEPYRPGHGDPLVIRAEVTFPIRSVQRLRPFGDSEKCTVFRPLAISGDHSAFLRSAP